MSKAICKRGDRGQKVWEVQEWLNLHGYPIDIDGDFGEETEGAVRAFAPDSGGVVTGAVFESLTAPMTRALADLPPAEPLGEMVVAYARQHLWARPREVGGQNRGPWVRLYCQGLDGPAWAWCAGFVSYIIRQACDTLGLNYPLGYTLSCDSLAVQAKEKGLFLAEGQVRPEVGDIFLVRRTPSDWVHTGIVTEIRDGYIKTIEGNTNNTGSREGFEAAARKRELKGLDFVRLSRFRRA